MKKWKCTVCGYLHTGNEPPEKCPVCGADRNQFVEDGKEPTSTAAKSREIPAQQMRSEPTPPQSKWAERYEMIMDLMSKQHAHPMSVHIPNGVLPMSVVLMILAVLFQAGGLKIASFYSMVYVAMFMPFVLFSGYVDWQKRYNGYMSHVFVIKMICGALVTALAFLLVIWQIVDPDVIAPKAAKRSAFIVCHLAMLAVAGTAGFLGGKLVFKD